jgi:ribonuclease E
MAKKMLIDATHAEETRVVVVDGNKVEEFDFETAHPPPASGQHLSCQGHAGRALAAGGLCRLRRQPARLPGLRRNPSGLLPDPGRRPAALLEEERAYARSQSGEGDRRTPRAGGGKAQAEPPPRTVRRRGPEARSRARYDDAVTQGDIGGHGCRRSRRRQAAADAAGPAADDDAAARPAARPRAAGRRPREASREPYRAADHAAEIDDQIESVADEDVSTRSARRAARARGATRSRK